MGNFLFGWGTIRFSRTLLYGVWLVKMVRCGVQWRILLSAVLNRRVLVAESCQCVHRCNRNIPKISGGAYYWQRVYLWSPPPRRVSPTTRLVSLTSPQCNELTAASPARLTQSPALKKMYPNSEVCSGWEGAHTLTDATTWHIRLGLNGEAYLNF